MTISERVYAYYTQNFEELAPDKQFHFASRLAAWNDDAFAKSYLKSVKSNYSADKTTVQNNLTSLLENPPAAKINAAEARQPYFDKYPELRGRMLALFRVRHLLTIYGEDFRDTFLELVDKDSLYELSEKLQADDDALKILSTYAINYIYLVEVILFPRQKALPLEHFIQLGDEYDITNPEKIQLLIYFYTHCIIGASNFYANRIPDADSRYYIHMIQQLESLIDENFNDINLDNKYEFLVCCRILGFETNLTDRINEEGGQSLSGEGDFVVDTINTFKQSKKTSFSDSEHRNVLLIMSASDYSPAT